MDSSSLPRYPSCLSASHILSPSLTHPVSQPHTSCLSASHILSPSLTHPVSQPHTSCLPPSHILSPSLSSHSSGSLSFDSVTTQSPLTGHACLTESPIGALRLEQ